MPLRFFQMLAYIARNTCFSCLSRLWVAMMQYYEFFAMQYTYTMGMRLSYQWRNQTSEVRRPRGARKKIFYTRQNAGKCVHFKFRAVMAQRCKTQPNPYGLGWVGSRRLGQWVRLRELGHLGRVNLVKLTTSYCTRPLLY
jgi:hypothetical protein